MGAPRAPKASEEGSCFLFRVVIRNDGTANKVDKDNLAPTPLDRPVFFYNPLHPLLASITRGHRLHLSRTEDPCPRPPDYGCAVVRSLFEWQWIECENGGGEEMEGVVGDGGKGDERHRLHS